MEESIGILPRSGARSRRAASLTERMSVGISEVGVVVMTLSEMTSETTLDMTGSGAGGNEASTGVGVGIGAGIVAGVGIGVGAGGIGIATGVGAGAGMAGRGAGATGRGIGRGAGAVAGRISLIGPTGSPRTPLSPSGTEDGAATGSEKTGSTLVFFVMSSIAFCKSLSTVGFICPPLK